MLVPFTSINFSNVKAQEYDGSYDYDDDYKYSQYPTEENKYECRTGSLEGFFVSSVEFCKHLKFDDKTIVEIIIKQEYRVHLDHRVLKVYQVQQAL